MQKALPEFTAAGARVVAIGNGNPDMARSFIAEFGVTFPVYTDSSRIAYDAAGLKSGFGINFAVAKRAAALVKQGLRQGSTQGSAWQQGGTLVLDPEGRVLYHHIDQDAADHAPLEPIFEALRTAA
jgi:peroxiredoxin